MFHRKPVFVSLNECTIKKDGVFLNKTIAIVKKNKIEENAIS